MQLKATWADKPAFLQFLQLIFIMLISFLVGFLLWMISLPIVFGIDLLQSSSLFGDFTNPKTLLALEAFQTMQGIFAFILPVFLFAFLVSDAPISYLQLGKRTNLQLYMLAAFSIVAAVPLLDWLSFINYKMDLPAFLEPVERWMKEKEAAAAEITKAFLTINNVLDLIFKIIMIALLPAIGEELLFRGALQRLLSRSIKNPHIVIFIVAFLFSAIHMQFYGFLPRFLMGVYFGYLLLFSGSLWIPILAHFTNNAIAVVMAYLNPLVAQNSVPEIGNPLAIVASSMAVTALVIYVKKIGKQSN